MKLVRTLAVLCCVALLASFADLAVDSSVSASARFHSVASVVAPLQGGNQLVYADFETVKDNRPYSSRGGWVQLNAGADSATLLSRVKGKEGVNPATPEVVRLKQDDPNRAISFDYELPGQVQWAFAALEVHGQPDKDGKPVPDDLSAYQFLSIQLYATGVTSLRAEFISRGNGIEANAYPQLTFKVSPGFNTYRLALKSLTQPSWAEPRVGPKDVLKKLTSVSLSAYCNQCLPMKGTIVVDNMIFQN